MRPYIIGIGGTGGKVLKEFLRNEDVPILGMSLGEHIAFGGIKGVWMDFDTVDCLKEEFYTGRLEEGNYPGFIVPPEVLSDDSKVREYILKKYGYDLRRQGFDRRAEYMKAIFEIFQTDPTAKNLSSVEYGAENPLLAYIWQNAISGFLTIGKVSGQSGEDSASSLTSQGDMEVGSENDAAKNHLPVVNLPNHPTIEKILSTSQALLSNLKVSNGGTGQNACGSLLFIASLGGGTGTGFVNPLTSFIRTRGSLLALALCIFTEKGEDSKGTPEEQRDLGAIIAMYDLLIKEKSQGIDALILIDNQILQSNGSRNYLAANKAIFDAMKPLIDQRRFPAFDPEALGLQRVFFEGLKLPGVLVPCYLSIDSSLPSEKDLVNKALREGKLFPCDIKKADEAYIFSRGLLDPSKLQKELQAAIGKHKDGKEKVVYVYPKIGENNSAEILILLRNPYGGEKLNFSRDNCDTPCNNKEAWKETISETFEQRIYCAICMGLRHLKDCENEIIPSGMKSLTKVALGTYLFGLDWIERNLLLLKEKPTLEEGEKEFKENLEKAKKQYSENKMPFLKDELEKSLVRLEKGEKPIFVQELNIFAKNKAMPKENDSGYDANQGEKVDIQTLQPMIESEVRRILGEIGYPLKGE
jgi:hypothetical protein